MTNGVDEPKEDIVRVDEVMQLFNVDGKTARRILGWVALQAQPLHKKWRNNLIKLIVIDMDEIYRLLDELKPLLPEDGKALELFGKIQTIVVKRAIKEQFIVTEPERRTQESTESDTEDTRVNASDGCPPSRARSEKE